MRYVRSMIVALVLCAVLTVPVTARAAVPATYTNWGYVTPTDGGAWGDAWRWFDYWGWYGTARARAERVWIQPFAPGWSWTWTSGAGWLAMRSSDLSSTLTQSSSGVRGTVTYGPLCPIEPCGVRPSPVQLTFFQQVAGGATPRWVQVWTDANGQYATSLSAGTWVVSASVGINWSATIVVPTGTWITRNFTIDSGIR